MADKRRILFSILAGILISKTWGQETVRLVEGPDYNEGRVEVYYSGAWGAVCGAEWDLVDAAVVCHSLGYSGVSSFQRNVTFKPENGTMWMSEVQCTGNETSLTNCAHSEWGRIACAENQAAGVSCFEKATPRFITSSLDTITLAFHVPAMKNAPYALEIWSNTTKRWQNTRCRTSTVKDSCILTNLTTSITVTDLSPGRTYFVRFTSSRQWRSEVSQAMKTKKLGTPIEPRVVSKSSNYIVLKWTSSNSVLTNYTVEMRCCQEMTWVEARCTENLVGQGCTVSDTTATVIGLNAESEYHFRVYAEHRNWKSDVSLPIKAMTTTKATEEDVSQDKIWIIPLKPGCVMSEIGQMMSLLCSTPYQASTVYEWSKEEQILSNKSENGLLNVTISSSEDFGLYTCHAISSSGVTSYNISLCQRAVGIAAAVTDPFNRTAVAVITACFICFAVFIVVLILLKMARLHRKKKKQARELNSGREEMAMLHYRQKSSKTANNNEDDGE